MIRLRKYIAVILLGIFALPIIFQSVHTVWHNSYFLNHHCRQTQVVEDFHSDGENISKEDSCLICDFQFSINDSPQISFLSPDVPSIDCLRNELTTLQLYKQVFSDKTPRAPPVIIS